ncbi:MAG: AAA family ATPase [Candidatus Tectomicrobia bacterium]|uniref:AAA family ATPase n=1 Tax=Tectimicrobiota bacterium TaxID=2528274 RepID=A0A932G1K1_UNCTE|nr:AAA family ATPase [Candidatus Tectomicrobia bacterium]
MKERPFNLTPDPRFLYLSEGHQEALAHLIYGVRERRGFVLLTGEVGTGKTTLLRAFLDNLDEGVRAAYIFNPHMSFVQLLRYACIDFGLSVNGQGKAHLLGDLNRFLLEGFARGENAVLVIDEAQDLSVSALEEIRLLSNLETAEAKLLQLVLVGQPELDAKLDLPALRQLRQRIGLHYRLSSLDWEETQSYIRQRLQVAGVKYPTLFTPKAQREIYRITRGVPRLINLLCDQALLTAYAEGQRSVGPAALRGAARDLGWKRTHRSLFWFLKGIWPLRQAF